MTYYRAGEEKQTEKSDSSLARRVARLNLRRRGTDCSEVPPCSAVGEEIPNWGNTAERGSPHGVAINLVFTTTTYNLHSITLTLHFLVETTAPEAESLNLSDDICVNV